MVQTEADDWRIPDLPDLRIRAVPPSGRWPAYRTFLTVNLGVSVGYAFWFAFDERFSEHGTITGSSSLIRLGLTIGHIWLIGITFLFCRRGVNTFYPGIAVCDRWATHWYVSRQELDAASFGLLLLLLIIGHAIFTAAAVVNETQAKGPMSIMLGSFIAIPLVYLVCHLFQANFVLAVYLNCFGDIEEKAEAEVAVEVAKTGECEYILIDVHHPISPPEKDLVAN